MASDPEQTAIENIISKMPAPVKIVELGGHHGNDTLWLKAAADRQGPCQYLVVEPDAKNVSMLRERIETGFFGHPPPTLFHGAVADHSGTTEFWPSEGIEPGHYDGSGSIRKPKGHLVHFPKCKFPRLVNVPCLTYDQLCEVYRFDRVDLVWSDIQGAERDLVAGGQGMLAKTKFFFSEFEDVEMYEGQAMRKEFLSMLPDWDAVEVFDYNILLRNRSL